MAPPPAAMIRPIPIAFVMDRIDAGGTGRQVQLLLEGLDRGRFAPTLFLLREDGRARAFAPRGVTTEILGVDALFGPDGFRKTAKLAQRFREDQIQIVQTFFQDATFVGIAAARLARVPASVVAVRDLLFWTTPLNYAAFRLATRLADRVLVNSQAVRERVSSFVPPWKIAVIPNGIPIPPQDAARTGAPSLRAELGIDPGLPLVVLVSNCNRQVKRVDLLVEAVPLVLRRHSAHFLLVGDGHLRPALEARARELGVGRCITFAGERSDVGRILAEADLALNTSDSEGLSNSVMEAMLAGLPVVASDVAGNRELVTPGETGLLFKPGEAGDLAATIIQTLEDEFSKTRWGQAGRLRIQRDFGVAAMVGRHSRFYRSLAGRALSRPNPGCSGD
jgi:glycosyltransferase involved in cell wall biosynthesis